MRIALDGIIYGLQRVGGISTYWTQLCRGLLAARTGDVALRLPRRSLGEDAAALAAMASTVVHDVLPSRIARYMPCEVQDGLFHSSYYRTAVGRRVKQVTTVYDFVYERYRSGFARRLHSQQKARAIDRADAVLCISHSTRNDLLETYPQIDPARTFVTPLAFDRLIFFPDRDGGGPVGADMVLFVGQRGGYKRFDLAVEAIRLSPALRLGVVGGALTSYEQQMLHDRLGKRWRYLGRLDDAGLKRAYSSSYALVYPSDYEGFGLPLLEAMACGAPVVTNRLSSLGEVGGPAAMFSETQTPEAYAAALGALENSTGRARYIAEGLDWSARFHWADTIARTLEIYDRL